MGTQGSVGGLGGAVYGPGVGRVDTSGVAKRDLRGIRYDILDPDFEEMMARIAHFGAVKYGEYNWQKSRLSGDQGPVNHIRKHLASYIREEPYDHPELGTKRWIHLAAIAFNAMMEAWYELEEERKQCQKKSASLDPTKSRHLC